MHCEPTSVVSSILNKFGPAVEIVYRAGWGLGLGPGAGFPFFSLSPEYRRASSTPPRCVSPAPPCRRPPGSPHASSAHAAARGRLCSPTKPRYSQSVLVQVDEGGLFLVADASGGGRKRPRGCSAANWLFSPLRHPMADARVRLCSLKKSKCLRSARV